MIHTYEDTLFPLGFYNAHDLFQFYCRCGSFLNGCFSLIIMEEKKCRIDLEAHPIDGIRIKAKGDKAACEAKQAEVLKNAGPFLTKFTKRRWDHVEPETS